MEGSPLGPGPDEPGEDVIPPDAPVETPQADPRAPDAPDPMERGTPEGEGPDEDGMEVTREIGDAFQ